MSDDSPAQERRVYCEVLEIPGERIPPDYFTLLGVSSSIDDATAFEFAAKQQSDRLRQRTPKELVPVARQVLKRIEKARICLSDARSRRAYLESLNIAKGTSKVSPLYDATPTSPSPVSRAKVQPPATKASSSKVTAPPRDSPAKKLGIATDEAANELDLDSLLEEFSDDTSTNFVGLADVPYKPKKSNDQVIVVASVAAVSVLVLAGIGLTAYFLNPGPSQSEVATLTDQAPHPVVDKPGEPAPRPVAQGEIKEAVAVSGAANGIIDPNQDDKPLDREPMPKAVPAAPQVETLPASAPSDAVTVPATSVASRNATEVPNDAATLPAAEKPNVPTGSLEGLVDELDLPSLQVDKSAAKSIDEGATAELGYIDDAAAENLRITIDEPQSKQFPFTQFYIKRLQSSASDWEIRLKAEPPKLPAEAGNANKKSDSERSQFDAANAGFDEVVASLNLDDSGLKFRWGQTARATMAEQLRNCVLVLATKDFSKRIQLRRQQVAHKFMFDLSKSNHVYEVADEHLPNAEAIRLEISNIQLPGINYEIEPSDGIIAKGETLRIKTLDDTLPVEFQFALSATDSKATVKFVPRHQLGRRWYPFTGGQVHSAIDDLQRALDDGRGRFGAAQSAVSSLPSQISSVESSISPDRQDYAQLQSQRIALIRQLNSARGTARRLSKTIPEMESKLPQLNSLVTLGKRIHLQGRLEFCAYVPLEEGKLVLLKTGTEEPPVKKEKAKE